MLEIKSFTILPYSALSAGREKWASSEEERSCNTILFVVYHALLFIYYLFFQEINDCLHRLSFTPGLCPMALYDDHMVMHKKSQSIIQ
jgi:hypothetical protein